MNQIVCYHSGFEPECLGCWRGHATLLESQLRKLEESTALPVHERIEKAVREQMEHCYAVYKGVPPTVEDWVGGALHYVMWGVERDLPTQRASAGRGNNDATLSSSVQPEPEGNSDHES